MIVLLTKHIICLGWFLKLKYYLSFVLSISIHEFIYILIRKADSHFAFIIFSTFLTQMYNKN